MAVLPFRGYHSAAQRHKFSELASFTTRGARAHHPR
jgi:hypothetical protein